MALPQPYVEKEFYTEAEYLAWEEDAPYKSEYVNGQIIPLNGEARMMSGGTSKHGRVSANVIGVLWSALKGTTCYVMTSDTKVYCGDEAMRYPDASVICGTTQHHDRGQTVITNPLVLVEVLSPGTEAVDRGEKLHEYQSIDSLQSYLLVEQRMARVEQYARTSSGEWTHQTAQGLDSTLTIPALNVTLSLADIYDGIDFTEKHEE